MITSRHMAEAFQRNTQIIKLQSEEISHRESLISLPFRGNCLNWIVGHLLTNRNSVFKLLDREDCLVPESLARYRRESQPITGDEPGVIRFETLLEYLDTAQVQLSEILTELSEQDLNEEVAFFEESTRTRGEWLFFFYFHDCYHTGQTEILRQAAGKDDQVI